MHSRAERQDVINVIRRLPADLEVAVKGLDEQQLDTPYREGGWTVRQVVHHLAHAHMNGFIRIKLMLTEDRPMLKPHNQTTWAQTVDATQMPVANSLAILQSLHNRSSALLESLLEMNFHRMAIHERAGQTMS